ncbi:integrase, partial [Bacteroides uniformis]|nr:integrase [Bacteroides uniformis]
LQHYINENKLDRAENQTAPLFQNWRDGNKLTGAGVTYLVMKYVTQALDPYPDLIPAYLSHIAFVIVKPQCICFKRGVNIIYIRDIQGHTSITTTKEIYARADSKQRREALESAYKECHT